MGHVPSTQLPSTFPSMSIETPGGRPDPPRSGSHRNRALDGKNSQVDDVAAVGGVLLASGLFPHPGTHLLCPDSPPMFQTMRGAFGHPPVQPLRGGGSATVTATDTGSSIGGRVVEQWLTSRHVNRYPPAAVIENRWRHAAAATRPLGRLDWTAKCGPAGVTAPTTPSCIYPRSLGRS